MNVLITIRRIKKMYDNVNTKFNLDMNDGTGVESGNGRIWRGANHSGYVWWRLRESVDLVFSNCEFPYR